MLVARQASLTATDFQVSFSCFIFLLRLDLVMQDCAVLLQGNTARMLALKADDKVLAQYLESENFSRQVFDSGPLIKPYSRLSCFRPRTVSDFRSRRPRDGSVTVWRRRLALLSTLYFNLQPSVPNHIILEFIQLQQPHCDVSLGSSSPFFRI